MVGEEYESTELGSPQGGVISPLIANIYLDRFDQFMKSRGHRIVRYADDILILCSSNASAENARRVATGYLEENLKLKVNIEKTHIAQSDSGVNFLGVSIRTTHTQIQEKKLRSFKKKVKQLTRRNQGRNVGEIIRELNPLLRGFVSYFKIANCVRELKALMGWVRRRLRCIQLKQWKKPKRLHRKLRQLGYQPPFRHIRMKSWRNANSPLSNMAMPNIWFHKELGLVDMASIQVGVLVSVV